MVLASGGSFCLLGEFPVFSPSCFIDSWCLVLYSWIMSFSFRQVFILVRGNRNISLGSFGPIFDFVVVFVLDHSASSSFQQSGLSSGLDYLSFLASNLIDAL